ncbi:hypothetical protein [Patulibacter minatonensis]|uniref:hypothetical protein n=1 Tax=Patulibacter minatonensis TaxID=298163 RepID=UPI000479EF34|nr:hypothetical protein [Patulibacter minatonensis]
MSRSLLVGALGAASTVCATLALAPAAGAADGTYDVYACKGPTGSPVGVAGWTSSATSGAGATDGCAGGGPFSVTVGLNAAETTRAAWSFAAPAGTRVAGVQLNRATQGFGGAKASRLVYELNADGQAAGAGLEGLTQFREDQDQADLTAPVTKPGLDASGLSLGLRCSPTANSATCPNGTASVNVQQAVVTLKDAAAPSVGNVQQTDSGDVSGVLRTKFDASDVGGGLYRVRTLVDGQPFLNEGLGDANCADADPATPDTFQYLTPQPCVPSVAGREVAVDYRKLSPGPHTVQTDVQDAAGNTTTVSAVPFPKANVDGTAADYERLRTASFRAWFVKGSKHPRSLSVNVGTRTTVRGDVVDKKGKGIAGVRLDVYHVLANGKRTLAKTGLKTRTNGRFTYIVSSRIDTRKIQMTYRIVRPGPVSNRRTLALRVTKKGKTFYLPGNKPKAKKSTKK